MKNFATASTRDDCFVRRFELILSCEHASNRIPAFLKKYFSASILKTHRAIDFGALELAGRLQKHFSVPCFTGEWSRLVTDLNRSPHHPQVISEFLKSRPEVSRPDLLARFYTPYRSAATRRIGQALRRKRPVLHLSVHSFTPALHGKIRQTDIGLLYDPARQQEKDFCRRWKSLLAQTAPEWRVRYNYPYRGASDAFTTTLRHHFGMRYLGVEIEINQKYVLKPDRRWKALQQTLIHSLERALA